MCVYHTKVFLLNIWKYEQCYSRLSIMKGMKISAKQIPSLRGDFEFRVALDEQGASHQPLLLGKLD